MKAIETNYKGYRFRSRLEARWAVFFDELNVAWDYEPQGFDLDELGWYLPDFWLEDHECWFEVKGQLPDYYSAELRKLRRLGYETDASAILAAGPIAAYAHFLFAFDLGPSSGGEFQGAGMWKRVNDEGLLIFGVDASRSRVLYADQCFQKEISWVDNESDSPAPASSEVHAAYMTARGARFEHGENGRRRR